MSKLKLRRKSKIFSEKLENRCYYLNYWFEKPIKVITNFSCEKNSKYARAISNYNLIETFKIHDLWIKFIDANTSCLVCEYNKDKRVVQDLTPFWDIFNLIDNGIDDNSSLMDLIKKHENEYDFSTPISYKDRYKLYRKRLKNNTNN